MATEYDDSQHYGFFMTGTTLTSQTGKYARLSELVLAGLRAQGVLDDMVDGTTAPTDTFKLWLDKNTDPAILKRYDPVGLAWVPVTRTWMFGIARFTVSTIAKMTAISESLLEADTLVAVYEPGRGGIFRVLEGNAASNGATVDEGIVFESDGGGFTFIRRYNSPIVAAWYDIKPENSQTANDAGMVNLLASLPDDVGVDVIVGGGSEITIGSHTVGNKKPIFHFVNGGYFSQSFPNDIAAITTTTQGHDYAGVSIFGRHGPTDLHPSAGYGGVGFGSSNGVRFKPEGDTYNIAIQSGRTGGQTQINLQCTQSWGTCDTSGTTVTRVSGTAFTSTPYLKYITINYVKYTVASVDSADQITLTGSAGTQSGVKYRCVGLYNEVVVNTNGTTVTRVSGDSFGKGMAGGTVTINGVDYTVSTFDSTSQLTLSTSAGTQSGVTLIFKQDSIAPVVYRLQVQPGTDEQSMTWGYNEVDGYFMSSVVTGAGEDRPFSINAGSGFNVTFHTDLTTEFFAKTKISTVDGIGQGLEFENTAGEILQMGFLNSSANSLFAINYSGSGGDDITISDAGAVSLKHGGTTRLATVSGGVSVTGALNCDTLIAGTSPPATASETGAAGTIQVGGSYLYVCTGTDTWKRAAVTTF